MAALDGALAAVWMRHCLACPSDRASPALSHSMCRLRVAIVAAGNARPPVRCRQGNQSRLPVHDRLLQRPGNAPYSRGCPAQRHACGASASPLRHGRWLLLHEPRGPDASGAHVAAVYRGRAGRPRGGLQVGEARGRGLGKSVESGTCEAVMRQLGHGGLDCPAGSRVWVGACTRAAPAAAQSWRGCDSTTAWCMPLDVHVWVFYRFCDAAGSVFAPSQVSAIGHGQRVMAAMHAYLHAMGKG
eukprot:354861-Chlamydomonas_euryale.AAC.9